MITVLAFLLLLVAIVAARGRLLSARAFVRVAWTPGALLALVWALREDLARALGIAVILPLFVVLFTSSWLALYGVVLLLSGTAGTRPAHVVAATLVASVPAVLILAHIARER